MNEPLWVNVIRCCHSQEPVFTARNMLISLFVRYVKCGSQAHTRAPIHTTKREKFRDWKKSGRIVRKAWINTLLPHHLPISFLKQLEFSHSEEQPPPFTGESTASSNALLLKEIHSIRFIILHKCIQSFAREDKIYCIIYYNSVGSTEQIYFYKCQHKRSNMTEISYSHLHWCEWDGTFHHFLSGELLASAHNVSQVVQREPSCL